MINHYFPPYFFCLLWQNLNGGFFLPHSTGSRLIFSHVSVLKANTSSCKKKMQLVFIFVYFCPLYTSSIIIFRHISFACKGRIWKVGFYRIKRVLVWFSRMFSVLKANTSPCKKKMQVIYAFLTRIST